MEHRSIFIIRTCFFLFLMLITLPYFSRGEGGSKSEELDREIYEIDYRGPETHSYVPPPDHSHGANPHSAHYPQTSVAAAKATPITHEIKG